MKTRTICVNIKITIINREGVKTSTDIAKGQSRLEKDAMAKHLGIVITEIKPGYACAIMKVTKELLNGLGITHGSAVFALADIAFAAASNSHGPEAMGLNVNINYLKATKEGAVLTAVAREENLTKRTGVYRMEVRDESGAMIALAEGLVYRRA